MEDNLMKRKLTFDRAGSRWSLGIVVAMAIKMKQRGKTGGPPDGGGDA